MAFTLSISLFALALCVCLSRPNAVLSHSNHNNLKRTSNEPRTTADGWSIIQERSWSQGGKDTNRTWNEYREGFSSPGMYWAGLENVRYLTRLGQWKLRIEVTLRSDGSTHWLEYPVFVIGTEKDSYRLFVKGPVSGDMGDMLKCYSRGYMGGWHNYLRFSTWDHDEDRNPGNCASRHGSGWWFNECYQINLNGFQAYDYDYTPNCKLPWTQLIGSKMLIRPA